jgi:hypothetical protein
MMQKVLKPIQRVVRWFFGAPFRQLPPEFGETVPPDLLAFKASAAAGQRRPRGSVQPSNSGGSKQTKPHR